MKGKNLVRWLAVLVLGVAIASPLAADWLVTQDGARIETKGPWKVKRNQVIFTLPNGTLSALRKSEVDLDASAVATANAKQAPAEAARAAAEEKPERRSSVAVFNNKNIGRAAESPSEERRAPAQKKAKAKSDSPVVLVSWDQRDSSDGEGLEIIGSVRNEGSSLAANIRVQVTVLDNTGAEIFETTAFMRSTGLMPGRSTTFRALLPGIFTLFTDPRIEVEAGDIELSSASPEDIKAAEGEENR